MSGRFGEWGIVIFIYIGMVVGGVLQYYVGGFWGNVLAVISMGFPIALLLIWAMMVRLKYAEYVIMDAVVRGERQRRKKFCVVRFKSYEAGGNPNPHPLNCTETIVKKTNFGKFKGITKIFLIHVGQIEERLDFQQRSVDLEGFVFKHPHVDSPVFYQVDAVRVEYGQKFPVFLLKEGGGDYGRAQTPTLKESQQDPLALQTVIEGQKLTIATYRSEIAQLTEKNIALETENAKHADAIRGLLKGDRNIMNGARMVLIDMINATANLKRALEQLGVKREIPWPYVIVGLVAAVVSVALIWKPDIVMSIMNWLTVTNNQIFTLVALAIICTITYYLFRRRKR